MKILAYKMICMEHHSSRWMFPVFPRVIEHKLVFCSVKCTSTWITEEFPFACSKKLPINTKYQETASQYSCVGICDKGGICICTEERTKHRFIKEKLTTFRNCLRNRTVVSGVSYLQLEYHRQILSLIQLL